MDLENQGQDNAKAKKNYIRRTKKSKKGRYLTYIQQDGESEPSFTYHDSFIESINHIKLNLKILLLGFVKREQDILRFETYADFEHYIAEEESIESAKFNAKIIDNDTRKITHLKTEELFSQIQQETLDHQRSIQRKKKLLSISILKRKGFSSDRIKEILSFIPKEPRANFDRDSESSNEWEDDDDDDDDDDDEDISVHLNERVRSHPLNQVLGLSRYLFPMSGSDINVLNELD